MDFKGYYISGCLVIAEDKEEALTMYKNETGNNNYSGGIIEKDLDETFYYFDLSKINEEDMVHIYDKKYPNGKEVRASLKRPNARKYREVIGTKKEVIRIFV